MSALQSFHTGDTEINSICTKYRIEIAQAKDELKRWKDTGGIHKGKRLKDVSKEDVDALYDRAIALGATCDGPPGQRIPDRFYGAYLRDLDKNKICFFVFG